jgi:hypothetical protein
MSTGWRKAYADILAAITGNAPPLTRSISTTPPLTGGGDFSADRTFAISAASGGADGSMSAADFSKLAGYPATFSAGALSLASSDAWGLPYRYQTPEIDLAATATTALTALAGYYFVSVTPKVVVTQAAGTQTAAPSIKIGNDAGHANTVTASASPSNATHASCVSAGVPQVGSGLQSTLSALLINAGTPLVVDVTAGTGTGGYVCKGRIILLGLIYPV